MSRQLKLRASEDEPSWAGVNQLKVPMMHPDERRRWMEKIGIGIPTKDRWDDLAVTLEKLEEYGLGENETIIIDDGSELPAPAELRARFPRVRFERSEKTQITATQRNRIAKLLTAPYFLQVDNDSFPLQGDLAEALAWLDARDDALALAFVIAERSDYEAALKTAPVTPFRCHYYIGCGALIKRELFLALGGYDERLQCFAEEIGVAIRACKRNLFIYQYAGVVIRHTRSSVGRNLGQRMFWGTRNELMLANLYYPFPFIFLRWAKFILRQFVNNPGLRWAVCKGIWAALGATFSTWADRKPLAVKPFLAWKRLPSPIKFQ